MFFLKILRYIKGLIYFKASGGFPERFINLCAQMNIVLNDVRVQDDILYSSTDLKGYKRIRIPARKSGMKVRICKKSGLPFFIYKNRIRSGLFIGVLLFFSILSFLSSFIWTVNVVGCDKISESQIISVTQKAGLKQGVRRKSIKVKDIEDALYKYDKSICFAAVNLQGSCAEIKIREKEKIKVDSNPPSPCDIIASKSGQIDTLQNFCGTSMLKENDAVLKGDVIISSIVENRNGTNTFKQAKGYVTAKTRENIESIVDANEKYYAIEKLEKKYEINLFHIKIPLYKKHVKGSYFKEDRNLKLKDKVLPLGLTQKRSYIIKQSNLNITKTMAQTLALNRYCNKLQEELRGKKVLESSISISQNRLCTKIYSNFILLENIGAKKELIFQ